MVWVGGVGTLPGRLMKTFPLKSSHWSQGEDSHTPTCRSGTPSSEWNKAWSQRVSASERLRLDWVGVGSQAGRLRGSGSSSAFPRRLRSPAFLPAEPPPLRADALPLPSAHFGPSGPGHQSRPMAEAADTCPGCCREEQTSSTSRDRRQPPLEGVAAWCDSSLVRWY